jgi:glycosyltransferase involved in cell wall biosynthesis
MRTLIIVPTHNEAANISTVLDQIQHHVPDTDIMVIDDASTDDTRMLVKQRIADGQQIELIERDEKRGLGDAYLHAFRLALDAGYDAVVGVVDVGEEPLGAGAARADEVQERVVVQVGHGDAARVAADGGDVRRGPRRVRVPQRVLHRELARAVVAQDDDDVAPLHGDHEVER